MSVIIRKSQDGGAYVVVLGGAFVPRRFRTFTAAHVYACGQIRAEGR